MTDPQTLLDAVDAEILNRLTGGGYEEYSEGDQKFVGMSLGDLRKFRQELKDEVSGGGSFSSLVGLGDAEDGRGSRGA